MISINGTPLPSPTALAVKVEPKAGSAQYNTLGQLLQDGMREKRTVEIAWARMAGEALAGLTRLLSAGGFFTLTYPDPLSGSREIRCRAAEQSARVGEYRDGAPLWADVKLTMEEQ